MVSITERLSNVAKRAILLPRNGRDRDEREAIAEAAKEGYLILGAAGERMRQENAKRISIALAVIVRGRVESELKATDTTNTPTQNEGHLLLARSLNSVVDALYDTGQTRLAEALQWDSEQPKHAVLAQVYGDTDTDVLIETFGATGEELAFGRAAYQIHDANVFIIEKRLGIVRRADIVVATPAYLRSQKPLPPTIDN